MRNEATTRLPQAEAERLADEIAEVAAHLDAATHRLLTLIRRFDASGAWYAQGALSCAHWLSWRIGLDLGAAREHVRVARALAELPRIDAALRHGRVSYSKVRALTRVASPENEASLLEMARSSTASQLERICRGYRRALGGILGDRPEDEAYRRWVRERDTGSGMVRFEIQVTPEEAAMLRRALELAMARAWRKDDSSADVSAETSAQQPPADRDYPPSLRRADALMTVAESYLATPEKREADRSGPPVEIVVHVEADAIADPASDDGAALDDGTALPRATLDRLACDAALRKVVADSRGNVLDVGRRRRTISGTLRRALQLRDRGCRFPGCTNRYTDGHHVVPWSHGGETRLPNLLSLCRRHHRFVHELGFRVEVDDRGGFAFFGPGGFALKPPPAPPTTGIDALRARHEDEHVAIDATTAYPRWDGARPDYDHIVGCLMARHDARPAPSHH